MALSVSISSNAAKVAGAFATRAPAAFVQAVAGALDRQNQQTVSAIQRGKLTAAGPRYLNVQTGRLRRSVRATEARADGLSVTSQIGSNVSYARVHEFGFSGSQAVRAYSRRAGKGGVAAVRAHSRRVNLPARRPFRDGIEERRANYSNAISRAILAAWASL